MSTYCTQQDLYDRFGQDEVDQLSDPNNTGAPDVTVVDAAIADASETIDGYIGTRYALPLVTTPPLINRLACNLARFELYRDAVPEIVQGRHDNAIAMLKQIAAGTMTLGLDAADIPTPSDSPQVSPDTPARVFTTSSLEDFTSDDY